LLDRRANRLKEILLREGNDARVIQHLASDARRAGDFLAEICRFSLLLHPVANFEQALALARTMAYIVYIDDYLEDEHPELELSDYRHVCQTFLLWHNRDLSVMPLAHATVARQLEAQFGEDGVSEEWLPMRHLVWEKFIWTMLQENAWLKHKERVTLDAWLANGLYSISFPILQVTVLAFSYESVSQELKNRLFRHICQASRVVRLANDLRTHAREAAQGRLNAVDLVSTGETAWTTERAQTEVQRLIAEELDGLQKAVGRERRTGVTQQFLTHLVGSTQAVLDFYESLDNRVKTGDQSRRQDDNAFLERRAG